MTTFIVTVNGQKGITSKRIKDAIWADIDGEYQLVVTEVNGVKAP